MTKDTAEGHFAETLDKSRMLGLLLNMPTPMPSARVNAGYIPQYKAGQVTCFIRERVNWEYSSC